MLKDQKWRTNIFKSLLGNGVSISLTKIVFSVSMFLLAVLIARKLGPEQFGKYTIVMSMYAVFELISTLGLNNLIVREVSKDKLKSGLFFLNGLVLGVFATAICFLLLLLACKLMRYTPEIEKMICAAGVILLPSFANYIAEAIFIGLQKSQYTFYVSLVRDAIMVILSGFFLLSGKGIFYVLGSIFISRFAGLFLYLYFFKNIGVKIIPRIDLAFIKYVSKIIPAFVLINITAAIFLEIDTLILSKTVAVSDVGTYSIAKKLVRAGFLCIIGVATAVLPVLSNYFSTSREKFIVLYKLFSRYLFLFSLLLGITMFFLYPLVIRVMMGKQYLDAVALTKILVWSVIPWSMSFLLSRFLIAGGHQNKDLLALCAGILSITICGISLSYKFGSAGMVYANVVSMCILAATHYFFMNKYLLKPLSLRV